MRRVFHAFSRWPVLIPGLGERTVAAAARCSRCRSVSFVRYGGVVLCLQHALALVGAAATAPSPPATTAGEAP